MRLEAKQAHRRLAILIALFLSVHFAAHFAAALGIEAQDAVLQFGRAAYRIPLVEVLLVLVLATQVVIGILLLRRIAKRPTKDRWHWLQFASGCYLAYFIVAHTAAALFTRLAIGLDTNFYWAAGSLVLSPLKYGFAPYYMVAVMALVAHVLAALHFRGRRRWRMPALTVGPVAGAVIVLAYGGAFYAIDIPDEHLAYFRLLADVAR